MAKEELLSGLSKAFNAATDLGKAYGNTKIAERMTVLDEQKKQNDFKREGIRFVFGNVSNILDMGVSALADIGVRMAEVKEETVHTEMEIKKAEAEEAATQKRERFNLEMEELRKDKDLQKRKDVLESIKKYQIDVADAVDKSISILACMPAELRQKVEEMLLEETKQYSELQRQLRQDAMDEMEQIETRFSNNERMKNKMQDTIWDEMTEMVQQASDTIKRMNSDVEMLNNNALDLSQKGQVLVEKYMSPMQLGSHTEYFIQDNS